jgi:hypothetical protein
MTEIKCIIVTGLDLIYKVMLLKRLVLFQFSTT